MKTKAFQTKRKPQKGFRHLYAKVRKRKQRVAATASSGGFAGEEPNLGIARALVVILILHVAAIVAIVIHNSMSKKEVITRSSAPAPAGGSSVASTQISSEDRWEWVGAGDTYERIARKHQFDVSELKELNNHAPLVAGMPIKLPALERTGSAILADESLAKLGNEMSREQLPPIQVSSASGGIPAEYEIVEQPQEVNVVKAIAPRVPIQTLPQKPSQARAYKKYKVKKGETVWAIATRHGISPKKLLSANRGLDPQKMRIGTTLKIPNR